MLRAVMLINCLIAGCYATRTRRLDRSRFLNNEFAPLRSIVFGAAQGLSEDYLNVYLGSWAKHAPETHIVLFFEKGKDVPAVVQSYGAEAVQVELPAGEEWANYRFYFVRDYMGSTAVEYDVAAISDVRDVAVQSNPWHHPLAIKAHAEASILVSYEAMPCAPDVEDPISCTKHPFTYAQDPLSGTKFPLTDALPVNGQWVRDCFGEDTFKSCFESAHVTCVGFTLGQYDAMKKYVDLWIKLASSPNLQTCSTKYHGADTAFHAYITHCMSSSESGLRIIKAQAHESVVNTLGTSFPHRRTQFLQVLTNTGDLSPVIHQYDRSNNLTKTLMAMYPYVSSDTVGGFEFGGN